MPVLLSRVLLFPIGIPGALIGASLPLPAAAPKAADAWWA